MGGINGLSPADLALSWWMARDTDNRTATATTNSLNGNRLIVLQDHGNGLIASVELDFAAVVVAEDPTRYIFNKVMDGIDKMKAADKEPE